MSEVFLCANSGEGGVSEVIFFWKWLEPILASVSEFERKTKMSENKMAAIIKLMKLN